MKSIVFATNNKNKVREVNEMLDNNIDIISLADIGCHEDIPETRPTIPGNALQKAWYVYKKYGQDVFAEDTGLEVDALGGEPGVYTARYAGEARNDDANMKKVLDQLDQERGAQFHTAIVLILDGTSYLFEGICRGTIVQKKQGTDGFGYDPIFMPDGFDRTFAQMTKEEKNAVSHRGQAVRKLLAFLRR